MTTQTQIATDAHPSSGGRLVALDGRPLPLEAVSLRAESSGGLARVVLEQRFRNPYPLHRQKAFIVPGVVPGKYRGILDSIPTWDEWDPDSDRWYYDWEEYGPGREEP